MAVTATDLSDDRGIPVEVDALARGLRLGIAAVRDPGADAIDLAALLEVYVRVGAWREADRAAVGLSELFRTASQAWVDAGEDARSKVHEGLSIAVVVDSAYELSDEGEPDEDDVVRWAAAALRIALLARLLEPEDRLEALEAVAECTSVADSHPTAFMPAAMLAAIARQHEPVDRWPPEAAELLDLFSRLPLLAEVDGEL
ncbi:MAG: hypothetical protein H6742_13265 [Alphaproteobacteria bacterium]|nr:hypothetical protein [Alphaproteobacteria bacterium]